MTFLPLLPLTGVPGWNFLSRTLPEQQAAHSSNPQIAREEAAFREKIGSVRTAEDLVSDYGLLKVALGAFGLGDDQANKFFIKKVLEEGTLAQDSLANKLSDPRYAEFSKAFGFGDFSVPRTVLSTFPDEILSAYRQRSFEAAVGEADPDMRLALGLERDLASISNRATGPDSQWFLVMGSAAVRTVFETALGLPDSFATLDIDQQLGIFRERSSRQFGVSEVADFLSGTALDDLRRTFLLRASLDTSGSGAIAGSAALALLSGGNTGSSNILATLYGA
ncbi:DUF1217 domain-containing protein [Pseudoruegeria sp. SK021]|uniref:DUF1217 domain-containing protein n=1 Tax=Pseudoruegeria sp. SK021 TaxID=1933035 RepID=UPI000A2456B6|nr:DUF1217 domain-containing protein [Pseudoruegeria sp. SK021]OSP54742.1 flagellar protein [Pseudoruegeria sp. SK021]